MESSYTNNNHHHHHQNLHLQDQPVGSSSSSATPYYGLGTTPHPWGTTTTPTTSFMNTNNGLTPYQTNSVFSTPREYTAPDLAFHNWANTDTNFTPDLQLPRIKDEFSNHYYRRYTDLLNGNEQDKISQGDLYGRGYNQIFPSISVSSLNQMGLTNGGAGSNLDMNLEALDLLTSSSFSGNFGNYSQNYQVGILRDHAFSNYADQTQQSHQIELYDTSNKISAASSHGSSGETKRSSNKIEAKVPSQSATKKSRLEARASCPPFKVTKEKLGDRIAALQQLVAPFGKTDTASVLMEAIGYIKFLQDQVETLSVPYMKASRNKPTRLTEEDKKEGESKRDLRSRGLCLVPLSCLSYITDGGGAVVWPPLHHFGGPA